MRDDFEKLLEAGKELLAKQEIQEAILNFELALEKAYLLGSDTDALAVNEQLGKAYTLLRDHDKAIQHYENNLTVYTDMHDTKGMIRTLNKIGLIQHVKGNPERALEAFMKSIEFCKEIDDKESEAVVLKNIGKIHSMLGNHVLSLKAHTASLDLKRKLGDRRGEALGLFYLGQSQVDAGDFNEAKENLSKALEILKSLGLKADMKKVQAELDEINEMESEIDLEIDISRKMKGKLRNKFIADDFVRWKK